MHPIIQNIKEKLGNSSDIVERTINNLSYIYLESVASDDKISLYLNESIITATDIDTLFTNLNNKLYNSHIVILNNIDDAYYYLSSGYTCLFMENEDSYLAIETKSKLDRGVTESSSEPLIRGPKDSFTENNATNIGLIRKRIKDYNLHFDEQKIGRRTKTKVTISYIDDIADKKRISIIKQVLKQIDIDGILDSGYIRDYLEKKQKSSFPKVISTERPDLACINLLNGKIIILVENCPTVLIIPATFDDFLKSSEDYYLKPINATFSRIIRYISFIITILTPALYIAFMTFNQEMIPDQLLISLATQRSQVPFPTFIEVFLYIIIFEILREADIRSPSVSGASMSIVGALVLGDASVAAGLVSPIVIIVVAITSICELVFSDMDMANAIRQWRMIFIFSTIFTGIIGIVAAGLILIIKLASIETLDTPYLIPFSPLNKNLIKDSIFLSGANKRKFRPNYLTMNQKKVGEECEN